MSSAWNQSAVVLTGLTIDVTHAALADVATVALGGRATDNSATGWQILEGANPYLTAVTTDDKEFLLSNKNFKYAAPVVIADVFATWALVLGTAGAHQTKLTSNVVTFDGTGGTGCTLTFPTASDCSGVEILLINLGNQPIVLVDANGDTVAAASSAILVSNGTSWYMLNRLSPLASLASSALTGLAIDNSATGWRILEGANAYLTAITTNDAEAVRANKRFATPALQIVTTSSATYALVLGTAGANETKLLGNTVAFDISGGTGCTLTLPSATTCDGSTLTLIMAGSQTLTVGTGFGDVTIQQDGVGVFFANTALGWLPLNRAELATADILSGTANVANLATNVVVSVGAAYNGKPVTATLATADATFLYVKSAIVAAGNLTITGVAASTGGCTVNYIIDGR